MNEWKLTSEAVSWLWEIFLSLIEAIEILIYKFLCADYSALKTKI